MGSTASGGSGSPCYVYGAVPAGIGAPCGEQRIMERVPRTLAAVVAISGLCAQLAAAQFTPPRIQYKVNPISTGREVDTATVESRYYVDRGLTANINKGDVLNVYREVRLVRNAPQPMRIFIGTMLITEAQAMSSIGQFVPSDAAMAHPMIRFKTAMKSDIVVPRLVIDNSVLFDPGQAGLKAGAAGEFQKVATFVQLFSPAKLVIEGHTDSDGDAEANRSLSEQRATSVKNYLVSNYNFITAAMIDAKGYGEEQPIVPNDSPENKQLNRRIEVLVWE